MANTAEPGPDPDVLSRRIIRHLRSGGRVLDAGSGSQGVLRALRRQARRQGIRLDCAVLLAPGVVTRSTRTLVGRLEDLPLADQVFDVVWAGGPRGPASDRVARELFRVTLPGGTLLTGVGASPRFLRTLGELGCQVSMGRTHGVVRLPGPRAGRMPVRIDGVAGLTPAKVRSLLDGLPLARGYDVVVKPLRWRSRPHVQAWCEFELRRITIQVPEPFLPFTELVPYRARRLRGKGLRFAWYVQELRFTRPDELIRYLYLHEYYHWYLREVRGKASAAETACDRFALQRM